MVKKIKMKENIKKYLKSNIILILFMIFGITASIICKADIRLIILSILICIIVFIFNLVLFVADKKLTQMKDNLKNLKFQDFNHHSELL